MKRRSRVGPGQVAQEKKKGKSDKITVPGKSEVKRKKLEVPHDI